ncbi:MAG: carbohydrate kinase family protein [Acidobacteria bacterium]|nr:carbohydrate kinase family protein [Acidobacteriota bacterium]
MLIACIGGAHIDRHAVLKAPPVAGTSNPGNVTSDFGGVARNVAENLARLGCPVALVSLVGEDDAGRAVIRHLQSLRVDTSLVAVARRPTGSYTAILDPAGELVLGLADMDLYEDLTPPQLEAALPRLCECDAWFVDANLPEVTLGWLAQRRGKRLLAADAVSVAKASRLRGILGDVAPLFLNRAQAEDLGGARGARQGVLTAGAEGVLAWEGDDTRALPALPAKVRDVTGAGDALIAGALFRLSAAADFFAAVEFGLAAAAITVESPGTVARDLTAELVYARLAANLR